MAEYADLIGEVRRECPEAPRPSIERELKSATVEFCRKSRFVKDLIQIELVPGQREYRLRGRRETRIDQVLGASLVTEGGSTIALHHLKAPALPAGDGQPRYFGNPVSLDKVHFSPTPIAGGSVYLSVVLVPRRDSANLPDEVYERHRDALISGAIARMTIVSNTPWSNPALSAEHQRRFELAVRDARQMAVSEGWAPMKVAMRRWV